MQSRSDTWRFYGWWGIVLPVFVVIWTSNALTLAGINVFDNELIRELSISRGDLKFGETLQLLSAAALAPVGGWVADRWGVRPAMTAGVLLLSGALYYLSQVDSLADVYVARIAMGGALAGAGLVICVTIVSRWFVSRRGLALGLMLSGTSLGNAVFPQISTWMIGDLGWRQAFALIALVPLALLPVIAWVIKERPALLGMEALGNGRGAAPGAAPANGMEFGQAIRSANFWLVGISAFCTFFSILGVSANLFLHMGDLGYGPAEAARGYVPLFVMGLVGKMGAGALSELLPRKAVFALCLTLMLAGAALMATLDPGLVWPALWLFGLGWGGNYTMLQALVADVFGSRSLGRILGAITVIDATGGALGPWVVAASYDSSGSYQAGFMMVTLLVTIALVAAMMVRVPDRPAG